MNRIDEIVGKEQLDSLVEEMQPFFKLDHPEKQRAAFVVLKSAVEERMLAKNILKEPEVHVREGAYPDEAAALEAGKEMMENVEKCLDVAEALLVEW